MIKLSFLIFLNAPNSLFLFKQSCKLEFKLTRNVQSNIKAPPFIYGFFEIYKIQNAIEYKLQVSSIKSYWRNHMDRNLEYLNNLEAEKISDVQFKTSCDGQVSKAFIADYEAIMKRNFNCTNSAEKEISVINDGRRIIKIYSSRDIYLFNNIKKSNKNFTLEIKMPDSINAFYNIDFVRNDEAFMGRNNLLQTSQFEKCRDELLVNFVNNNLSLEELINKELEK